MKLSSNPGIKIFFSEILYDKIKTKYSVNFQFRKRAQTKATPSETQKEKQEEGNYRKKCQEGMEREGRREGREGKGRKLDTSPIEGEETN